MRFLIRDDPRERRVVAHISDMISRNDQSFEYIILYVFRIKQNRVD